MADFICLRLFGPIFANRIDRTAKEIDICRTHNLVVLVTPRENDEKFTVPYGRGEASGSMCDEEEKREETKRMDKSIWFKRFRITTCFDYAK